MQEVIELIKKKGIVEGVKRTNSVGHMIYKNDKTEEREEAMYNATRETLRLAISRDEEVMAVISDKKLIVSKVVDQIISAEDFTAEELEIEDLDSIEKLAVMMATLSSNNIVDKFLEVLIKGGSKNE